MIAAHNESVVVSLLCTRRLHVKRQVTIIRLLIWLTVLGSRNVTSNLGTHTFVPRAVRTCARLRFVSVLTPTTSSEGSAHKLREPSDPSTVGVGSMRHALRECSQVS
jgi:hypothetical protein